MENARTFTERLADLLRRERVALADFLVALAEFDARALWVELGYSSLFDFLHRELGLSKASTFYRMRAAELIRRFPDIVEPLRDGRLCLTTVVEVAKVLTPENRDEVLPRFFQLSKREAKAVSAAIRPDEAPPRRDVVTAVRIPAAAPALAVPAAPIEQPISLRVVRPDEPARANASERCSSPPTPATTPAAPAATAEPLTAELNRLHLTVSREFLKKLDAARRALSHSHPGASAQEVLEAGLDLLLERHAKRRGLVKKPRHGVRPSKHDHIPAHVRRAVWERDGGKCQAGSRRGRSAARLFAWRSIT